MRSSFTAEIQERRIALRKRLGAEDGDEDAQGHQPRVSSTLVNWEGVLP